jgi:hypothetical protein
MSQHLAQYISQIETDQPISDISLTDNGFRRTNIANVTMFENTSCDIQS